MAKFFAVTTLLLCVLLNQTVAQTDSLYKTNYPTTYTTVYNFDRNLSYQYFDTAVNQNEIFHPLYRQFGIFQDLGNMGTAGQSLVFTHQKNVEFYLGSNPYQHYFKTPQTAKYYNSKVPVADFNYLQGPNDLLNFSAVASANITPRLNVGVDFNRNTGLGFYRQQSVSQYYTQLFGSYTSKNKAWAAFVNYNWNRGINQESGGLVSDSIFEGLNSNNKAAPLKLASSESRFRNNIGNLKVYRFFGSKEIKYTDNDSFVVVKPQTYFSYEFTLSNTGLFFDNKNGDVDSTLFPAKFYDSTGVFYDSINHDQLKNRFAFTSLVGSNNKQHTYFEVALNQSYNFITQRNNSFTYNNLSIEGLFERIPLTKGEFGFKLNGQYCFAGYNQNDIKLNAQVSLSKKLFFINAGFLNHLYTPDFTQVTFYSNPFIWNNNFSKINLTNWHATLSTKTFKHNFTFSFNQYLYANFVYNNTDARPTQTNNLLLINRAELDKTFNIWRLYFSNKIIYQKANSDIVRLPDLGIMLRYYLQFGILNKVLNLQVGTDVFYNTAFYGNNYNPVLRMFYLQNEKLIGNYPLVDVFVNAHVKKAIFFVKYGHVNANLINQGFYNTPGYPLPLRAFYFGFRWRMYN